MTHRALETVRSEFRRALGILAVFSFGANALLLTIPLYMLQVYDRILPSQSEETLIYLSLIAGFALIVLGIVEVARSSLASRIANRFDIGLSETTLRNVLRRGPESGGDTQPMRDLSNLRNLLSSRVMFSVLDLPFAFIFIAIMYLIHPLLFWITAIGALVLCAIAIANQRFLARATLGQIRQDMDSARQAEHLARNADSLVAMGMVGNVIEHWGRGHAGSLVNGDRAARINAWFAGLSRILRLSLQVAVLGIGAYLVLAGEMTAGMIFAAALLSGRGLQPIDQLIASWRQLNAGWQSWHRIRNFLDQGDTREYTPLPEPRGALAVENVFLPNPADPARKPIISRVSFEIEPGEVLAVVGPSGSGKSTLASILVGVTTPRSGHVRLDGHDVSNWNPAILGQHIGYVAQDIELLPGTIGQNISRFEENPDPGAIMAAARNAQVEELIQRMPQGYDTRIGPGGLSISGGEKQRIALARAFYGSPSLLVLDEPNPNLDRHGEQALLEALRTAKENGAAVVIITQRETALAAADRIMRMKDGQVVDIDSREKFLAKAGMPAAASAGQHAGKPVVHARFSNALRAVNKDSA